MSKFEKRKNRLSSLTDSQIREITGHLGESKETTDFLARVDSLLGYFASEHQRLGNEISVAVYKKLKRASTLAKELAEFLTQQPIEEGEELNMDNTAEHALYTLEFTLESDQLLNKDRNLRQELFQDLPDKLDYLIQHIDDSHSYHLKRFAPATKPPDYELEFFSKNLIFGFQSNIKRIPVINYDSADFEALRIVYHAFNYVVDDDSLVKHIKQACKERRKALNLEGRYKIDFRGESSP